MPQKWRKEESIAALTFAGRGNGTVIPLQIGRGEGCEGVERQTVRTRQPLLKVQKILWLVVFRHVGGYV